MHIQQCITPPYMVLLKNYLKWWNLYCGVDTLRELRIVENYVQVAILSQDILDSISNCISKYLQVCMEDMFSQIQSHKLFTLNFLCSLRYRVFQHTMSNLPCILHTS